MIFKGTYQIKINQSKNDTCVPNSAKKIGEPRIFWIQNLNVLAFLSIMSENFSNSCKS